MESNQHEGEGMKKLLLGAVLAVLMALAFASVASAQSTTSSGDPYIAGQFIDSVAAGSLPPSYNLCGNSVVAQTYAGMPANQIGSPASQGNPTVVKNVDPDGNGIACDTGTTTVAPATTPMTTASEAPATTPAASTSTTAALPNTGGPIVLLPAAALLIGSGLLAFGISRRK